MRDIPCILLSRDRLQSLERLVDHLLVLGYTNLYILDIGSTYPPLLDYYQTTQAKVLYAGTNIGHKGLWVYNIIDQFKQYPWVMVSDSDIELDPDTPADFAEQLILAAKDLFADKAGLAIRIDDITNEYLKRIVTPIEENYWKQRYNHKLVVYGAGVDTTMCVVRTDRPFTYQGIRVANWPVRHLDWYSNWDNLTEEEQYYMDHADPTIATTVAHYNLYKQNLARAHG